VSATLRDVRTELRPVRRTLVLAVLAGSATVCCGIGLFATAGWLIARAAEHPEVTALAVAVVAVRGFGIGRGAFRYLERLLSHDAALRSLVEVRPRAFRRLARVAPGGLRRLGSGDLLARVLGDVDSVQDLLVRGVAPTGAALLAGVAVVLLTAVLYGPAGVVLGIGLLVAGVGIPALTAALTRRSGPARTDVRAEVSGRVAGVLDGAADVLAYGAQDRASDDLAVLDRRQSALARREALVAGAGTGLGVLVAGATVWTVTVLAAGATSDGRLDRVLLVVVVLATIAAFDAVSPLAAAALALGSGRRSAARLAAVLDGPDAVPARAGTRPLPPGAPTIALRSVGVRYAPDAPWALRSVDADLPPGRRLAVVGPSGSGKSTLVSVLLRFRDADSGSVTLDGEPVEDYDPATVRRRIGGCPADPHVFASTLRENLRLADPAADDARLDDAAARAGLLDWIRTLPEGWSTAVGARGASMSGGQRQRLALARALLADPPVLVLDEPTASLDPDASAAFLETLFGATSGRTVVLVTHDLTALSLMDEILVLDAGTVVQRGTHAELSRRPGLYREMCALDAPVGTPPERVTWFG
jgi:ATP-binding cassette subfamily C protein CydC